MKFKQFYLSEKFKTSYENIRGEYVEIFEQPTSSELRSISKISQYDRIRLAVTDKAKPNLYAWSAELAIHFDVQTMSKIKFDFGFTYKPNSESLNTDSSQILWDKKIKNKESILKLLKKTFPKANEILFPDGWVGL